MYVRVVRFTGVSADRIQEVRGRMQGGGGPPEGVRMKAIQVVFDESQGTAVVIQQFDSADDMRASTEALNAMDPGETPGTRATVDAGEVVAELRM